MRFKLNFELENEKFPIQYRKNVMSFIKKSLNEYSPEHYEKLYHEKDNIIKPYTFAVFFNTPEFKENEIILKDKKDHYYSFSANQFLETVKINIREQLKITNLPEGIENTFEIKPIQAKKVIVKFYEKKIEGSIGTFEISGDRKLLEVLYKSGIGSKRSAGFGMFEII